MAFKFVTPTLIHCTDNGKEGTGELHLFVVSCCWVVLMHGSDGYWP